MRLVEPVLPSPRLTALLGVIALSVPLAAQANLWAHPASGDWFLASNWIIPAAVPTAADAVTIDNGGTALIPAAGAVAASLAVGSGGSGALGVNGGELTTSMVTHIASAAGSQGTVSVSGPSGRWTANGVTGFIGFGGYGTLNISGGGSVTYAVAARIGALAGSSGHLVVTDPASTLTTPMLDTGVDGQGEVTIAAGGSVNTSQPSVIGSGAGGNGSVVVGGAGSSWNAGGDIIVGQFGAGGLAVNDQGAVHAPAAAIRLAQNPGSTGELIIGAQNVAPGTVNVTGVHGGGGNAVLVFAHGANNLVFSPQIVGSVRIVQSGGGGTVISGDNSHTGGTDVTNGTLVANHVHALGAGPASVTNTARLRLSAPVSITQYTQAATSTLETSLSGPACNPMTLDASQAASLAGVMVLDIGGGCAPVPGQSFPLITSPASGISGTFTGLPDGATWIVGGYHLRIHYTASLVSVTVLSAPGAVTTPVPALSRLALLLLVLFLAAGLKACDRDRRS